MKGGEVGGGAALVVDVVAVNLSRLFLGHKEEELFVQLTQMLAHLNRRRITDHLYRKRDLEHFKTAMQARRTHLHVSGEQEEDFGVVAVLFRQEQGLHHVADTERRLSETSVSREGVECNQSNSIARRMLETQEYVKQQVRYTSNEVIWHL